MYFNTLGKKRWNQIKQHVPHYESLLKSQARGFVISQVPKLIQYMPPEGIYRWFIELLKPAFPAILREILEISGIKPFRWDPIPATTRIIWDLREIYEPIMVELSTALGRKKMEGKEPSLEELKDIVRSIL